MAQEYALLSPGSWGLALSLAAVDSRSVDAGDWEELAEDIPPTTKSGPYNQTQDKKQT